MTKKISNQHTSLFVLLWLAVLSSSCKRLIEVPSNPPTAIAQVQQFADSATALTALVGVLSYPTNGAGGFAFNDGCSLLYRSVFG